MKRILFGKRATKLESSDRPSTLYKPGSVVLGSFYRETKRSIEFRLPNGQIGECFKEYLKEELSSLNLKPEVITSKSFFIKEFNKDLYIELLILGDKNTIYECTFFTQKVPQLNSLVTGFIKAEEEMGYTVEIGIPTKTAILQTEQTYCIGELAVFQVKAINRSAYILTDKIVREVYVGEKNEICPGILLRTTVTGRPRYVIGEKKPQLTNLPYAYLSDALGVCNPILESREQLEVDDESLAIIVYVSEDREKVHAVSLEEYQAGINQRLPAQDLVGQLFMAKVRSIRDNYSLIVTQNDEEDKPGIRGSISAAHYSDHSTDNSAAPFKESDYIQVRVFAVKGYFVSFTAKESLLSAVLPVFPLSKGSIVPAVVTGSTSKGIGCETFGGSYISIKKFDKEEFNIGKIYQIQISQKGDTQNMFLGHRYSPEDSPVLSEPRKRKATVETTGKRKSPKPTKLPKLEAVKRFKNGEIVDGVITKIYQYGAFAEILPGFVARIKIAEVSSRFVPDWQSLLHLKQRVKLVLYEVDYDQGRVEGSIKKYEVLQMVRSAPEELTTTPVEPLSAPLVYAEEEIGEEESSTASEEDEEFQMELFNSKNGAGPWTKRIYTYPPLKAYKLWQSSLEATTSPETKKETTLAMITALGRCSAENLSPLISIDKILGEGFKRDGSVFLKKALDNCRNSSNSHLFYTICLRFIKEKKEAPFGYKELLYYSIKENSLAVAQEAGNLIQNSEMKSADKKECELAYASALYRLSKSEARSHIEKKLASTENKIKSEWAIKYANLESSSIQSPADIAYARNLLDKLISSFDLPFVTIKNLFKTYLTLEKEFGTKEQEAKVLEMAKQYVAQQE
ncbi:hypothetical protein NEHOM01_1518 [Nematocida homosporus]|uniref:uncharacterized protein n=1 Tax=Nematocida homosporus TaxID=1912981 RepID=UPI002220728C|nr:uncharacterized protein NEHOM01_1518 [Nematocida homosporus]KAI5186518.1 hypothetical protein NEHOM01_1518 [Nematocida homosporus]